MTVSERVLARLCDRSFLKLWTYPNLFKKPNKELTDLLVVFGSDVIIFSDKSCAYPNSGNARLDWSRWYRRAIQRSVHQIDQAERWLRAYPEKVFVDGMCTQTLPVKLPSPSEMRVHRVCVALGAGELSRAQNGVQDLTINPSVVNDAEILTVGRIDPCRGWVHVFDEASLGVVLTELSTVSDFIHYLMAKESLLDSGRFVLAESETDILAYYLWHGRTFPIPAARLRLKPNLWARVQASREFLAGREANQVSAFWDGLIEYITDHCLNGTLEYGNELDMSAHERLVRTMAGETRFSRRVLSKSILDRAERARAHAIGSLLLSGQENVNYVLFIGRGDQGHDHAAYRRDRAAELQARCIAAKAAKPEKRFVVGMAMDARGVRGSSEDFVFMDTEEWSADQIAEAEQLRRELGYFLPGQAIESRIVEVEYPGTGIVNQ